MKDVILAGVPRSGTTLACILLNNLANTVALNEPFTIAKLPPSDDEFELVSHVRAMFKKERRSLLQTRRAKSKSQGGRLVSNVFAQERGADGLRHHITGLQTQNITIDKSLSEDFALVVKHPNAFTTLLPILKRHFPCHAIVRNPLAVLLSWESTAAQWQNGRVNVGELFDLGLKRTLDSIPDAVDRRVHILYHYFGIYRQHLPRTSVIKYEDMIEDARSALGGIVPADRLESPSLANMNCNPVYSRDQVSTYLGKLLARPDAWEPFYSDTQIRQLRVSLAECG